MEINQSYATLIAAFIAALIGSFCGAYFKEKVSNWFSKTKRKAEIRIELTKLVVQFFMVLKQHIDYLNSQDLHNTLSRKLSEGKNARLSQLSQEQRDRINSEIKYIFEISDKISERSTQTYSKLIELESLLSALSLEASHHFEDHQYKQLRKAIKELKSVANSKDNLVDDYFEMDFAKVQEFQKVKYVSRMRAIFTNLDKKMDYYEEHVNEILN